MSSAPVALPADRRAPAAARLRLAAEVVATYFRARWRLRRSDLPATLAELRARGAGAAPPPGEPPRVVALRLSRAALRTLAVLPADSRCLMRSLVVSGLLARRGIDSTLVVAVRAGGNFAAHAWVEIDGQPLFDPASAPFERLVEL